MKIEDTDAPIGINGWLLHLSQTYWVKLMGLYESSSGLTGWREKDILAEDAVVTDSMCVAASWSVLRAGRRARGIGSRVI